MSYFNEENTIEQLVLDTLVDRDGQWNVAEPQVDYFDSHVSLHISNLKWRFVPAEELPRQHSDVLVESMLRDALIRLNPEIKAQPDRADEVLYRLRAIPLSVQSEGLVRAICRTNRVYPGKTHGLIVDYLGVFDDVATVLDFDEKAVLKVITNLDDLKQDLPGVVAKCLGFFPGVDRTVGGYEGLIAAQDCLPDNARSRRPCEK
jgi:hypothetical protein